MYVLMSFFKRTREELQSRGVLTENVQSILSSLEEEYHRDGTTELRKKIIQTQTDDALAVAQLAGRGGVSPSPIVQWSPRSQSVASLDHQMHTAEPRIEEICNAENDAARPCLQ